jgi:hypothetical protein
VQPRVAVAFDFDGTLAPDSTTGFLRDRGVDVDAFWSEGVEPRVREGWDPVPAYLYGIWALARSPEGRGRFTREAFRDFGGRMELFPGVVEIFDSLKQRLAARHPEIELEFYLISSGIGEILRSCSIAREFVRVWASDFLYDESGGLEFPRNIVSFTDKTRFLFELSKGIAATGGPGEPFAVNRRVPPEQWRIPLRQVVFVGDGYTDIPCFQIVRRSGGVAIGVYEEGRRRETGDLGLLADERVSDLVPADYRAGSVLRGLLENAVDTIAGRVAAQPGSSTPPAR